jgi:hypothetical protein
MASNISIDNEAEEEGGARCSDLLLVKERNGNDKGVEFRVLLCLVLPATLSSTFIPKRRPSI